MQKRISLLLDTNILVYIANKYTAYHSEANKLINYINKTNINIFVLTSSLKDAYYILTNHYLTESEARITIREFSRLFDLVDLTGPIVLEAFDCNEPDYEDGLIRVAAEALQVDAIVTYDKKAFKKSFIPSMTAAEALDFLQEN